MTDIAARAEAGEDAAVLLRELRSRVRGPMPRVRVPFQPDGSPWPIDGIGPYTPEWRKWQDDATVFNNILKINTPEAHLAAAMLLVPDGEGHDPFWLLKSSNPNNRSRGCRAEIWVKDRSRPLRGSGPTPAHALIAAIARSMNDGSE